MNGLAAVFVGRVLLVSLAVSAPGESRSGSDGPDPTAVSQEPEGCRAVPVPAVTVVSTASLVTDTARSTLRRMLYDWIDSVRTLEFQLASDLRARDRDTASVPATLPETLQTTRAHLQRVLDAIVFTTDWGADELREARRRFPGSTLFARYQADLASYQGRIDAALASYDQLLRQMPGNAPILCARGRVLERLGRFDDGRRSYVRALDIAPDSRQIFDRLLDVSIRTGRVMLLREQLERLQLIYPKLTHLEDWSARTRTHLPQERPADSIRRR